MSTVTPVAVIDESSRRLRVNIAQLNSRLPGLDRITSSRCGFMLLALHRKVPLDISRIHLTYGQECHAMRIQGTANIREGSEACDRCRRTGEDLKFLFSTCMSLSNMASGACANFVYNHKPNESSLRAGSLHIHIQNQHLRNESQDERVPSRLHIRYVEAPTIRVAIFKLSSSSKFQTSGRLGRSQRPSIYTHFCSA